MPTPSIIRSRSPVAVSQSCLPSTEEQQSSQQTISSRLQELCANNTDDSTKLPVQDNDARADVDRPLAPAAIRHPADTPRSPIDTSTTHSDVMDTTSIVIPKSSDSNISNESSSYRDDELSPAPTTPSDGRSLMSQSPPNPTPLSDDWRSASDDYAAAEPLHPAFAEWESALRTAQPKITSSLLRPFARFSGTQKSDRQIYNVSVELKTVDMAESFCCGYLTIDGLTANLPSITTYFEGEIIGTKYAFQTNHPTWGASEKTDLQHWSRFPPFAPLKSAVKAHRHHDPAFHNREHIFMRWKEQFLVPDHRKKDLEGASFEGFYYIMFDQQSGAISGIYFHSKSEKFQRLELQYEREPAWCPPAFEFR